VGSVRLAGHAEHAHQRQPRQPPKKTVFFDPASEASPEGGEAKLPSLPNPDKMAQNGTNVAKSGTNVAKSGQKATQPICVLKQLAGV
jgi:hypothetical protein